MALTQRAKNEIAHGKVLAQGDTEAIWGWGTPAGRLRAERRARLIAEGAGLRPGVRALEIGCGTGMFTEMFARTGAQIVGVDISEALLEKARTRNLPTAQVQFLAKRFEECDVDGPFDVVIGSSVLHHLDIEAALAKMYSLLKPGGRLSFAEPNMLNPQIFLERKLAFIRPLFWYVSPDETAFVRWSLRALLEKTGLQEVYLQPFDWLHPAIPSPLIPLVLHIGHWVEKTPGLREFAGSLLICGRRPPST
jgi:2-polyprenyl-3-methyl-5-hydroxy-6-metoxy-1,4-benzoquinol methylase